MASRGDLDAKFDLMKAAVRQAQDDRCVWDGTYDQYRQAMVRIMDDDLGPIDNMVDQARDLANQLLGPVIDPPPPVSHLPNAGFYASQRYGNGARQWGNLTIPSSTPRGVLLQVHGGGWMQGDPNVASPPASGSRINRDELYGDLLGHEDVFGLRQMASYAASRWNVIVWEPAYTYSSGNPEVCLDDVKAAIRWIWDRMNDWGVLQLPVVYAGHSAGGQLALRAALDPTMPAPKAWLGMAAAGLTVHQLSDVQDAPGNTAWIFQTAWGAVNNWPKYAPDSHLSDRQERFPLYIEQGNLNNHDDGSVNIAWARSFVPAASARSWDVRYHEQPGADHFAIRWDQSPTTRADMDEIWR